MGLRCCTHVYVSLIFIFLGLCSSNSFQLNDDVLGLIVFKADLIDPMDALRSWSEDDINPCNWTGIACDAESGRVITVQLHELSLSGHIGRGLGKLEYLQTLSLANNNITGIIDSELAQLKRLKKLDLSHNMLSGPINPSLGNLAFLKSLDFSSNALSGAIPADLFSNCKALHYLYLAGNSLDGPIPDSLGACSSLKVLNLSSNYLNNAMPVSMETLTELSVLDLSYNLISGALPTFVPYLVDVRLQGNKFSGEMPWQIGSCVMLEYLDLSNNFISGGLPDSMQRLKSLSVLNLANNFVSGSVPSWLGSLTSLKLLNLASNVLYGQMPSTLGLLKALQVADLSHNRLSGEIPSSLSGCVQLESLDLSSNSFSGTIPDIFTPGLISMRLSNNQLTGNLPDGFYKQCGSLQILDLSENQLQGAMSQQLASCVKAEYLNMSYNFFSGNIPDFHQGCSILMIDLSHNNLFGNIPASLGDASELSVLLLDGNKLNGSIPPQLGNCSSLTDINFSQNNLYGSIPPELGNLTNLEVLDLSHNIISGTIPPELGQLQRLAVFNVSYNQLQGPVPDYGNFEKFNKSAFVGNTDLCGANVNVTCPSVMPKPIVLNPNSSEADPIEPNPLGTASRHRPIVLSSSAILAISAAAAISAGVVIVFILNVNAQSLSRSTSHILDSFSQSPSSDMPSGKLVMFSKNSDPRSEEWVTSAHALLNKNTELGRGGFGTVYKAVLADGRIAAIKKLMVSSLVKSQDDFEKEIQFLGQIKHRNLLALQGYYWTPQLQLLIYDFIANGNLYSLLHEKSHADVALSWPTRFKIALGTARGLAHLHHACHPQVIHYNMKSSNVLLDESCNPKIADYGLAKLLPMPVDRHLMMSTKFQGASGYMAPEFACQSSRINEKCDVYGYGVMLLELVTGRRPVEYMEDDVVILCDHVKSLLDEGKPMICVDANLRDYSDEEVLPVIKLGLICTSQVPSNRPSMAEVVRILDLIETPGNSREVLSSYPREA